MFNDDSSSHATSGGAPTTVKPFTTRCRYHKDVEYVFKILKRVKNEEILQQPTMPQTAMLELYEHAKKQIEIQKEFCAKAGAYPDDRAYMPVPIAAMTVDEEWCRNKRCDYSHVAEMVMFPVRKALSAPTVTMRKEIDPVGNVAIYVRVADAAHRVLAATESGEKVLMCLVSVVDSVQEEAQIYTICNYHRRAHSNIDIFKGRKTSKEEKVSHVSEIADACGLVLATSTLGRAAYPTIKAVNAVESIYDKYGPNVLQRVFHLIAKTSNDWHCVEGLHTDMLQGLAMFVDMFEVPGFANSTIVEQLFHEVTPQIVIATKPTKAVVEEVMHMVIKSDASQDFRHRAVAATLFNSYHSKIKRMVRDKLPGAAQLRELLKLWHERKLSQYKHDRVVYYHDKIEDTEGADYPHEWAIPDVDSGLFPSHAGGAGGIAR